MAAFAVLRFINRKSLTYLNCLKEGFVMKKLMSIAKKASTALAALALVVATTSVPSACFHWFAQPVEPEELRNYVNKK